MNLSTMLIRRLRRGDVGGGLRFNWSAPKMCRWFPILCSSSLSLAAELSRVPGLFLLLLMFKICVASLVSNQNWNEFGYYIVLLSGELVKKRLGILFRIVFFIDSDLTNYIVQEDEHSVVLWREVLLIVNLWYHVSDGMKPEDVGLSKDLHFFKPKTEIDRAPRVTSATIYKCDKFEVSCICHIGDDFTC